MGFELLQHILVTIVAIGAVTVIVRRVAGVVRTPGCEPKCSSCPSAAQTKPQPSQAVPLTVIRSANRH